MFKKVKTNRLSQKINQYSTKIISAYNRNKTSDIVCIILRQRVTVMSIRRVRVKIMLVMGFPYNRTFKNKIVYNLEIPNIWKYKNVKYKCINNEN